MFKMNINSYKNLNVNFYNFLNSKKLSANILSKTGLLKQEDIEAMQNRNRSIERQMQLNDALLEMKNHSSSLSVVKEKMRKQEEEEKQRRIRQEMRDRINKQLEAKRLQEIELKQQKDEANMLLGEPCVKPFQKF